VILTSKQTAWGWWWRALLLGGVLIGCQQEAPDPNRGKNEQKKLDNLRQKENETINRDSKTE